MMHAFSQNQPHIARVKQIMMFGSMLLKTIQYSGRFYYAKVIIDVYSRAVIKASVYDVDNSRSAAQFTRCY